jgi:mRNA interferase YafQ
VKRQLLSLPTFDRKFKKLLKRQPQLRNSVALTLELLEADAFHPSLKTHKLKGELDRSWSCSAGYDLRIVFAFVEHENQEVIVLESIGTHEETY